jgi:hypothetical protein
MKKIELATYIAIILMFLLKVAGMPFASEAFIVTSILASTLFCYFSWYLLREKKEDGRHTYFLGGTLILGLSVSMFMLSLLFRVQLWRNSREMAIISIFPMALCSVIFLISYLVTPPKRADLHRLLKGGLIRCIIFLPINYCLLVVNDCSLFRATHLRDKGEYKDVWCEHLNDPNNREKQEKLFDYIQSHQ